MTVNHLKCDYTATDVWIIGSRQLILFPPKVFLILNEIFEAEIVFGGQAFQ